jgi:hypothetical protein
MARNYVYRRARFSTAASRDPAAIIDHAVTILALALVLCLLAGITLAAERGSGELRPGCTPGISNCCDAFNPRADCMPVFLRRNAHEVVPGRRA